MFRLSPDRPHRRDHTRKRLLIGVIGGLALVALAAYGIPYIRQTLNTVSTDDAYVNGHVTFVAPRVGGQVSRVLVDDNNRVRKGELIADLDKEPFQIAVSEKKAAVDTANADLQAAIARVRGIEAQARSQRWSLQHAVQEVDNQIALLQARIAALEKSKAVLALARLEFDRAKDLVAKGFVSREVFDQRQAELTSADAGVAKSLAEVYQVRASLGLPAEPGKGEDLGQVPPDLDENFSSVLQAQADLIQSAAELGVVHSYEQGPKAMIAQFEKLGDINKTFARLVPDAPAVKQAEARLETARRDLAQAELNLRYCDIDADIDGVITRRNVNPGDYVQVGQNLMAIRSLSEIWIDANFKETESTRIAHRPARRSLCRHVWRPAGVQGSGRRFHHGDRIDTGAAARGKRHGQFHQGRAAAAGSYRTRRTMTRTKARPVHRHFRYALCLFQKGACRAGRREVPASL